MVESEISRECGSFYILLLSWSSHHCDVRTGQLYPYMESVRSDVEVLASSIYGDLGDDPVVSMYGYPGCLGHMERDMRCDGRMDGRNLQVFIWNEFSILYWPYMKRVMVVLASWSVS